MKGPRRLRKDNELFAELVAASNRPTPRPEALEDLLRALPQGRYAHAARRGGLARTWMAVAGVGCLLAGVITYEASSRSDDTPAPVVSPSARPTSEPSRVDESPRVEAPSIGVPSVRVDDLPAAAAPRSAAPRKPDALRREFELIATAREALTKRETERCLATLRAYETEFPRGQFDVEAKAMRVEAVAASGDTRRARDLARDFLAKHSDSPYDARMRSLLTTLEAK